MRGKILAGNWKMNKDYREAKDLVKAIDFSDKINPEVTVILGVPSIYLSEFQGMKLGAISFASQNSHFEDAGAFTGEISAAMLSSIDVKYGIVGHSERRTLFGETDEQVNQKVHALLKNEISPILCVGEHLEHRKSGKHIDVVLGQCEKALKGVNLSQMEKVMLAYEPVWAIGTGEVATAEQAEEMHAAIRQWVEGAYNAETAAKCNVLYGGSCKPDNAKEIFSQNNVDGGLIGGASLKSVDFIELTNCF